MGLIQFDQRWMRQPQGAVSASAEGRRAFSNLWVINRNGFTPDLIGDCDLVRVSDPSSYGPGVSSGGTGLLGVSTASNSTPKGLNSDAQIAVSDEASLFVVATLNSITSDNETTLFRATPNAGSAGVAINLFPQSGRVRALLAGVSWQTGNDRTDSNLTVGVPWFFGLSYTREHGFWCYSSPVGRLGLRLGTQIIGWGSTVSAGGPAYIGGMSAGGVPFPGVIHAAGYAAKSVPREQFERIGSQPYEYLLAPRRIWVPVGGSSGTSYAFGVSGNFALSGASALSRGRVFIPGGVVAFSGSSPFTVTGAISYTFSSGGSFALSGAVLASRGRVFLPSGRYTFSGAAPFSSGSSASYTFTVSGSFTLSGTAPAVRGRAFSPSGGYAFSGAALWQKSRIFAVSGQVTFSGNGNQYFTSGISTPGRYRPLTGVGQ